MIDVMFLYVDVDGRVYDKSLTLSAGTTLREAVLATDWLDLPAFAHIRAWFDGVDDGDLPNQKAWYVGVFSTKKPLDYLLKQGDRVEFYRPLSEDPIKKRQSKVLIEKKKQARIKSMTPKNKDK